VGRPGKGGRRLGRTLRWLVVVVGIRIGRWRRSSGSFSRIDSQRIGERKRKKGHTEVSRHGSLWRKKQLIAEPRPGLESGRQ
jgi:hypothetical protein